MADASDFDAGSDAGSDAGAQLTSFGCKQIRLCDVREAPCQEVLYEAAACANGFTGMELPEITVLSVEEFQAMRPPRPLSSKALRWSTARKVLGLYPVSYSVQDRTSFQSTPPSGYYEPDTKKVYVVDRGESQGIEFDVETLVHEFAHEQRFKVVDFYSLAIRGLNLSDGSMAIRALLEGEATALATRVMKGSGYRAAYDGDPAHGGLNQVVMASLQTSEAPYDLAAAYFPYLIGANRLAPIWESEGREAIDALYEKPDLTMLAFMGPPFGREREPMTCYPTTAPPDYVAESSDRLGPVGVFALPIALGMLDVETALESSHHWRDDSLVMFRPQGDENTEHAAAAWRIAFDTAAHAEEFADAVDSSFLWSQQVAVIDRDVIVYGASDEATLDAWSQVTDCGSDGDLPGP